MKERNKNTNTKSELVSKLPKEDGQSEKLEEKRIKVFRNDVRSFILEKFLLVIIWILMLWQMTSYVPYGPKAMFHFPGKSDVFCLFPKKSISGVLVWSSVL